MHLFMNVFGGIDYIMHDFGIFLPIMRVFILLLHF